MIYSLRGRLTDKGSDFIVVECAGVGYFCRASLNTVSGVGEIGKDIYVYTYMNVYQDGVDLFAFKDNQELLCFKMLTTVSGVGPKAALSILSSFTPQQFALSVAAGDVKQLTTAKGVGKKMAERIILELKESLSKSEIDTSAVIDKAGLAAVNHELEEAVSALMMLGYTQAEISPYLGSVKETDDTSAIVTKVLRQIGQNK
jgi:Holliday junction DNA helicase RuvA